MGWARIGASKLPKADAQKKRLEILLRLFQYQTSCYVSLEVCSGFFYQEVLGESSSINTTARHYVEVIVVSMGQCKKSVVNTREEMYIFYGKHICYMGLGRHICS